MCCACFEVNYVCFVTRSICIVAHGVIVVIHLTHFISWYGHFVIDCGHHPNCCDHALVLDAISAVLDVRPVTRRTFILNCHNHSPTWWIRLEGHWTNHEDYCTIDCTHSAFASHRFVILAPLIVIWTVDLEDGHSLREDYCFPRDEQHLLSEDGHFTFAVGRTILAVWCSPYVDLCCLSSMIWYPLANGILFVANYCSRTATEVD